jgi:GNAT superfamily N-acetyltransferase
MRVNRYALTGTDKHLDVVLVPLRNVVRTGSLTSSATESAETSRTPWCAKHSMAAEVETVLVGHVSERFALNDSLSREGGHIGYAVLPAFRRNGYPTEILRQAIELAHQEAFAPLLVYCDEDNLSVGNLSSSDAVLTVVVLSAPFGRSRANTSPRRIARSIPPTA